MIHLCITLLRSTVISRNPPAAKAKRNELVTERRIERGNSLSVPYQSHRFNWHLGSGIPAYLQRHLQDSHRKIFSWVVESPERLHIFWHSHPRCALQSWQPRRSDASMKMVDRWTRQLIQTRQDHLKIPEQSWVCNWQQAVCGWRLKKIELTIIYIYSCFFWWQWWDLHPRVLGAFVASRVSLHMTGGIRGNYLSVLAATRRHPGAQLNVRRAVIIMSLITSVRRWGCRNRFPTKLYVVVGEHTVDFGRFGWFHMVERNCKLINYYKLNYRCLPIPLDILDHSEEKTARVSAAESASRQLEDDLARWTGAQFCFWGWLQMGIHKIVKSIVNGQTRGSLFGAEKSIPSLSW